MRGKRSKKEKRTQWRGFNLNWRASSAFSLSSDNFRFSFVANWGNYAVTWNTERTRRESEQKSFHQGRLSDSNQGERTNERTVFRTNGKKWGGKIWNEKGGKSVTQIEQRRGEKEDPCNLSICYEGKRDGEQPVYSILNSFFPSVSNRWRQQIRGCISFFSWSLQYSKYSPCSYIRRVSIFL